MYTTTMDNDGAYHSETLETTVLEKLIRQPLLPLCIGSFTGIAGYKLYQIRQNRRAGSTERLSLQLINTRMMAQGFVMGTLALSVFYMLGQRVYYKYVIKQPFPGSQTYK